MLFLIKNSYILYLFGNLGTGHYIRNRIVLLYIIFLLNHLRKRRYKQLDKHTPMLLILKIKSPKVLKISFNLRAQHSWLDKVRLCSSRTTALHCIALEFFFRCPCTCPNLPLLFFALIKLHPLISPKPLT